MSRCYYEEEIMKRFRVLSVLLAAVMLLSLAGCGKATIEGDWVLVKETWGDGSVWSKEQLEDEGIAETYHIEGDTVSYTCHVLGQDIKFDMDLVDNGDGTYTFKIGDIVFATATLKKNTFSYTVGEGKDASTMYFERQK